MKLTRFLSQQAKLIGIVTGSVALGGLTSVGVLAAIPDSNGTIHGCYGKVAGELRIIDTPSKQCKTALETPISWPSTSSGSGSDWSAYGFVKTDGTLDAAKSKNITSTLQITPNYYCIFTSTMPFLASGTSEFQGGTSVSISIYGNGDQLAQDTIDQSCPGAKAIANVGSGSGFYFFLR